MAPVFFSLLGVGQARVGHVRLHHARAVETVARARAAEARKDADSAQLDNVRDRCLRSEAAWSEMAARAERTEKMRQTLLADKERAAAEAAAQD